MSTSRARAYASGRRLSAASAAPVAVSAACCACCARAAARRGGRRQRGGGALHVATLSRAGSLPRQGRPAPAAAHGGARPRPRTCANPGTAPPRAARHQITALPALFSSAAARSVRKRRARGGQSGGGGCAGRTPLPLAAASPLSQPPPGSAGGILDARRTPSSGWGPRNLAGNDGVLPYDSYVTAAYDRGCGIKA